jgi:hypothetical protein
MRRTLTILAVAVISFVLGASCMYMLKRQPKPNPADGWITLVSDANPMGYEMDALVADVPIPKAKSLSGKAKFVSRDNGLMLGFVLKLPLDPLPTSSLPEKYRKTTKGTDGFVYGPPENLHLEGHYDFVLKDADGFVIQTISSPTENLEAGTENALQGMIETAIPASVKERTKSVVVSFLATKCYPCS